MNLRKWLYVAILPSFMGCANTPLSFEHQRWQADKAKPAIRHVLLFPAEVHILERFPGVIEEVPLWAQEANETINSNLAGILQSQKQIQSTGMHQNPDNYPEAITSHIQLLKQVLKDANRHTRGPDRWPHKIARFDYSIGGGLAFLKDRQVDAVMFVSGEQIIQNLRYDSEAPSIYFAKRKNLSIDAAELTLVLVDVQTGDLLWLNNHRVLNIDLRDTFEVQAALRQALDKWPVGLTGTVSH